MSKILCEFASVDEADLVIGNIKQHHRLIDHASIREETESSDDNTSLFIPFVSNTSAFGTPNNGAVDKPPYDTPSPLGSYVQYQDDPNQGELSRRDSVTAEIFCSASNQEALISKLINRGARNIRTVS